MKARDLAALAALGIAGKMAYDKFGRKKDDEPTKKKMGEGLDMTNQGAMVRATRSQSDAGDVEMGTKGAYLPETAELRTKGAYLDDTPEFRTKGAYLDERATPATPAAPAAKAAAPVAAVSRSVAAAPAAADAVADDYVMPRTAPKPVMPDATRVKAYNPDIMYNTTIPFDPKTQDTQNRYTDDEGYRLPGLREDYRRMLRTGKTVPRTLNALAATRNKRAGVIPTQMPDDAAAARIARQSTQPGEADARVGAEIARKKMDFQNRVAFEPARASSVPLEHSQNVSFAKQYQGGRAKGGVVKMASGGMASSKMSKPSGASRGDGIAQRGRTRGTLR